GDIRATGGVISTEMAPPEGKGKPQGVDPAAAGFNNPNLGEGDAHISGDTLTGSINSGDVTFSGHARLWQGQAVLDADQIAISRQVGGLIASGSVVAVFPQVGELGLQLPNSKSIQTKSSNATEPLVWQIRAQRLTYSNGEGEAFLEGGVTASSEQGSLHSQTLSVYLAPATGKNRAPINGYTQPFGGLQRAMAQGGVIVSQNGIHAYAEQAEYDAARGKFVFSGGQPRITDGNGNTTTGHSLTFDVASDTISVDSEEGSRTLTRHRVEK
ncbi:MAG TPA: LptA/OstA family protein, partial [Candidatus Acidoferrales bacterium]|nr:LptA/OstA family protein [Candidatus Acidoferrales bacterium]